MSSSPLSLSLAVIGAGSWGTTLAKILGDNGQQTLVWAHEPEVVEEINEHNANERFVPGGNSEGGVLPVVPAAPYDTIVESQWRKGHGTDSFAEPLQEGQSAGAKAAKKQKHARAKDKLAHFVLQSEA